MFWETLVLVDSETFIVTIDDTFTDMEPETCPSLSLVYLLQMTTHQKIQNMTFILFYTWMIMVTVNLFDLWITFPRDRCTLCFAT